MNIAEGSKLQQIFQIFNSCTYRSAAKGTGISGNGNKMEGMQRTWDQEEEEEEEDSSSFLTFEFFSDKSLTSSSIHCDHPDERGEKHPLVLRNTHVKKEHYNPGLPHYDSPPPLSTISNDSQSGNSDEDPHECNDFSPPHPQCIVVKRSPTITTTAMSGKVQRKRVPEREDDQRTTHQPPSPFSLPREVPVTHPHALQWPKQLYYLATPSTESSAPVSRADPSQFWCMGQKLSPLWSRLQSSISSQMSPVPHHRIYDAASTLNYELVIKLCRANPLDASYRGEEGRYPLHQVTAMWKRGDDIVTVVRALIDAYPAAVFAPDKIMGKTPLHYACRFRASEAVVGLLLRGAEMATSGTLFRCDGTQDDSAKDLVMTCAREKKERLCRAKCRMGRTALHYAIRNDAPAGVVQSLLRWCPLAAIQLDKNKKTPLKLAWDEWASTVMGRRRIDHFFQSVVAAESGQAVAEAVVETMAENGRSKGISRGSAEEGARKEAPRMRLLRLEQHILYDRFQIACALLCAAQSGIHLRRLQSSQSFSLSLSRNVRIRRQGKSRFRPLPNPSISNILRAAAAVSCHVHPTLWSVIRCVCRIEDNDHDPDVLLLEQDEVEGRTPLHEAVSATSCQIPGCHVCCPLAVAGLHKAASPASSHLRDSRVKSSSASEIIIRDLVKLGPSALRLPDREGRLPIALALENVHHALCWHGNWKRGEKSNETSCEQNKVHNFEARMDGYKIQGNGIGVIQALVKSSPDTIHHSDQVTGLYPFMLAAANVGGDNSSMSAESEDDEAAMNLRRLTNSYELLRNFPETIQYDL